MDEPTSQDANVSDGSAAPAPNTLSFDPRDLIPTPIFCASPEGRLVWMNAAAEGKVCTGMPLERINHSQRVRIDSSSSTT